MREQLLGDLKVRDDPVNKGSNGNHVTRGPPEHLLGIHTDRDYAIGLLVERHNGRLVDDDAVVAKIDKGVCSTEVNADIASQHVVKSLEHKVFPILGYGCHLVKKLTYYTTIAI